jgi:hypothetical protein
MTNTYQPMRPAHAWPARSTNGFAIAAFVLSILGWFFLSIPFGFVALHQIKHRGEDGRRLAIAGLVISVASIILGGAMIILGMVSAVSAVSIIVGDAIIILGMWVSTIGAPTTTAPPIPQTH